MENLLFVVWLLGWPILCSLSERLTPLENFVNGLELRDDVPRIIVWALVWLTGTMLLYRQ